MRNPKVIWQGVECEITSVSYSRTHRQNVAWLKAVKGEPFSRYSDGGPYQQNWTTVPLAFLLEQLSEGIEFHHSHTLANIPAKVRNEQTIIQE